jgi:hypothetical protein
MRIMKKGGGRRRAMASIPSCESKIAPRARAVATGKRDQKTGPSYMHVNPSSKSLVKSPTHAKAVSIFSHFGVTGTNSQRSGSLTKN